MYGDIHPKIADSYVNLANINIFLKSSYTKRIAYYDKALEIYLKIYGAIHTKIALVKFNLAKTYSDIKENEKCMECLLQVNEIKTIISKENILHSDVILENLTEWKQYEKCQQWVKRLYNIYFKLPEQDQFWKAKCLFKIGNHYFATMLYKKALPFYINSYKIFSDIKDGEV